MMRKMALSGAVNGYIYEAIVPKDRPFEHYTPRIVPHHVYANIPSEEIHIKWYRQNVLKILRFCLVDKNRKTYQISAYSVL
jgi:hypothetical protein